MFRFLLIFLLFCGVANAQSDAFPRMISINADAVNIRSGPGLNYPIQWIYRQDDLPIKVVAEYKEWRKFVDWQGDEGWVFKPLTKDKKRFLVTAAETNLYFDADEKSQLVARLGKDKSGEVIQCVKEFCNITVRDRFRNVYYGWVKEADIWGACTRKDDNSNCSQ